MIRGVGIATRILLPDLVAPFTLELVGRVAPAADESTAETRRLTARLEAGALATMAEDILLRSIVYPIVDRKTGKAKRDAEKEEREEIQKEGRWKRAFSVVSGRRDSYSGPY